MSAALRVRMYNVRFGDAILVSIPDRGPDRGGRGAVVMRHVLIDVGNVLAGTGGADEVFLPVIDDVLRVLDGRPLDLYVMTHEHLDHVQGLLHADGLGRSLPIEHAWLTASAEGDPYYDRHEDARRKRAHFDETFTAIDRFLAATEEPVSPRLRAMWANNNPRSTRACVAWLRARARVKTTFISRGVDLGGAHPFHEAAFRIWAPEEDTAAYYGKLQPMALAAAPPAGSPGAIDAWAATPPPGVDAGAFYNLVDRRRDGLADNLLAIDRAANDTSVVFSIEWRGWRLLFAGDAELRSWRAMAARPGVLAPVHFLKIGHHGSHNGTPPPEILDRILPMPAPDGRPRAAGLSTHPDTYEGVPDGATLTELEARCADLRTTADLADGAWMDFEFPG